MESLTKQLNSWATGKNGCSIDDVKRIIIRMPLCQVYVQFFTRSRLGLSQPKDLFNLLCYYYRRSRHRESLSDRQVMAKRFLAYAVHEDEDPVAIRVHLSNFLRCAVKTDRRGHLFGARLKKICEEVVRSHPSSSLLDFTKNVLDEYQKMRNNEPPATPPQLLLCAVSWFFRDNPASCAPFLDPVFRPLRREINA